MELKTKFGANLRRFRQSANLTQTELANAIGVTLQTVFSYESGTKWPRAENFADLSQVLKIQPWELLSDDSAPQREPTEDEALAVLARARGKRLVPIDG